MHAAHGSLMKGENIRVTGVVQGVGFRPNVWHLANECGIVGQVWNDSDGVLLGNQIMQDWAESRAETAIKLRQETEANLVGNGKKNSTGTPALEK